MATNSLNWKEQAKAHAYSVGADECGWGSWAGPLLVCAVAVPFNWTPPKGLNDSKKLRKARHEELFYILRNVVPYMAEMAHAREIDQDGASSALKRCYLTVVQGLRERFPDSLVIVDGNVNLRPEVEHLNFPEADGIVPAVMAASVIGKYIHDRYMYKLAEKYPGYDFAKNCGYHAPKHVEGILKHGLTPIHRRSYVPTELTPEGLNDGVDPGVSVDDE